MRNILNMLNLIEAKIQAGQILELIKSLHMRYQVIVEIEFRQRLGNFRGEFDSCDLILSET